MRVVLQRVTKAKVDIDSDRSELEYICKKIKNVKGVYDIQRITT